MYKDTDLRLTIAKQKYEEFEYICDLYRMYKKNMGAGSKNYIIAIYKLNGMQEKRRKYIKENVVIKNGASYIGKVSRRPIDLGSIDTKVLPFRIGGIDAKFLSFLMMKNCIKGKEIKTEEDIPKDDETIKVTRRTQIAHINNCIILGKLAPTRIQKAKIIDGAVEKKANDEDFFLENNQEEINKRKDGNQGQNKTSQWINVFSMLYKETGFYLKGEKEDGGSFIGFVKRFSRFRSEIETSVITSFYARSIEDWAIVLSIYFGGSSEDFEKIDNDLCDAIKDGKGDKANTTSCQVKTTGALKCDLLNEVENCIKNKGGKEDVLNVVKAYLKANYRNFGRGTYATIQKETEGYIKQEMSAVMGLTGKDLKKRIRNLKNDLEIKNLPYNWRILLIATIISTNFLYKENLCFYINKMLEEVGFSLLNADFNPKEDLAKDFVNDKYEKYNFDNIIVQYIYAKENNKLNDFKNTYNNAYKKLVNEKYKGYNEKDYAR